MYNLIPNDSILISSACHCVTMQTGALPPGVFDSHDPTICVERNSFLLIGCQHWRGVLRACLLRALLSHETQHFPWAPKGYESKPCLEVPHFLICPPASHTNRSPSSLECALVGFRVAIILHQLSFSGSVVRCSKSPHSGPETVCHAIMDHTVPEAGAQGGTCPSVGPCLQEWAPIHVGLSP